MPNKADKLDLRLRIAKSAIANGIKLTAWLFITTPTKINLGFAGLPALVLD